MSLGLGLGISLWSNQAAVSGGGATLSPYLGQVATRSGIATGTIAQTNIMSRASMYATENLTSFQVKFPAWHDNNGTTASIGSNVTYKASVEYPAGTFTQIKWAASASVVATLGGDTGLSDAITTAIPQGAQFWIRVYATTTVAGIPVNNEEVFSGDTSVVTGSSTDQTMSGTVTGTSVNVIVPLCVVQTTTRPTILILGDSRSSLKGQDTFGNTGQFAYVLGNTYGYINAAKSGAQIDLSSPLCTNLSAYVSHVINGYGINDFVASATAAQEQSRFIAMAYEMPGKAHLIATCAPDTTSTDSWATLGNQTPFAGDAARQSFNTWARAVPDPYFACVDVASVFESGSTGKWVVGYTTDGVHQNNTGCAALASSGNFNFATLGANLGLSRFSAFEYSPPLDWFDANNAATATSTIINPTLGSGSAFTGAVSANYGATVFNGGPGYTIGSGGFMNYQTSIISQNAAAVMLAILWKPAANPGSTTAIGGYTATGSNAAPRAMILQDSTGHPGLGIRRLDADTLVTSFGSTALTAGTPYLLVASFDPTNGTATLTVNGAVACTATYGTTGNISNTTAGYSIVNFEGSSVGTGVLGEYIGFNCSGGTSAIATIRQKLEGDVAWRRGAPTTFLPNTHPYYSARPGV